jgi:hypothetical protein
MTDKSNFITMLGKSNVSFQVNGNDVTVNTSNNAARPIWYVDENACGDKTTFTFDDLGNLVHTSCNC